MLRLAIPEDVAAAIDAPEQDASARLAAFSAAIAGLRDDAIKARAESGIERTWMACEEAYLGIDDANRSEFSGAMWAKPMVMAAPLVSYTRSGRDKTKSTAFVRLTSRYVDAGAAKIGEITQPIDDKPFKLDPTPVPDLITGKDDTRPVVNAGEPVMRAGKPGEQPAQLTVQDLAKNIADQAADAAEKATQRIYDWQIECKRPAEMRKVIFDCARIGTGILKGPVPKRVKARSISRRPEGVLFSMVDKTVPVSKWIDVWNLFPADDCGENVQDGSYIWERDFMSPRALRELKKQRGYVGSAIDKVLEEGPNKCLAEESRNPGQSRNKKHNTRFEIWYFTGEIKRSDLAAMNPSAEQKLGSDSDSVFAIVTLVNDTAIQATINPLESGKFPYHVVNWRRRAGHWAGVGVAEQVDLPQKITNAATRAMLNNAGKSGGPQIVMHRGAIEPAEENQWTVTPDKLWFAKADSPIDDVRKAFIAIEIPNVTPQMMSIIEYGFKLAEESSNIPLISQGQSGGTTQETFGAAQLQNNNANQLLRDVGYAFADQITNPEVDQYYEWLLLDPDVPDDEKGDFQINSNAAAAMIERAIQDQTIVQMGQMVLNPVFGADPKKWFALLCRAKRLDPRDVQYTEEQTQQMEQNQQPPLPLAVAQVRAESAEKIAAARDQVTVEKAKLDTDRDTAYQVSLNDRAKIAADAQERELAMKRELEVFKENNSLKKELDKIKASLAETTMELNVQRELAGADRKANQVATTEMEPVGRAPNGEAFQK